MCMDPMTMAAASFVIGAAQSVVGYMAQSEQAEAQEAQYQANFKNSVTATQDRYDAINSRVLQENAAKSQELQEASIEGAKARASTRVAAAEGGVSGLSVDAVLAEMYAKSGRFARNTAVNFDYSRDYWAGEMKASRAQGQSQINSVQRGQKPSFLPTALNIFGSAVSAGADYRKMTA